jgi:hypothetical protein
MGDRPRIFRRETSSIEKRNCKVEKGAAKRLFSFEPDAEETAAPTERDATFSIPTAAGLALVCLKSTGARDATGARNLETGSGWPTRIIRGHPMPEMVKLLPEPAELGA